MITYQLCLNDTNVPIITDWDCKLIRENALTDDLGINKSFLYNFFNFELSDPEVKCFRYHYTAWKEFLDSPYSWCLIIEDQTKVRSSLSNVTALIEKMPLDYDVFFPFDVTGALGYNKGYYQPYVNGLQWGSYAYFLSKNGAVKLLQLNTIRQPVDEEMLTMNIQGKLNCVTLKTSLFQGTEWLPIKQQRDLVPIRPNFPQSVWSTEEKERARTILQKLVDTCNRLNVPILLDSGTLLGHVRHGEIIPWDDDIDLAVHENDIDKVLESIRQSTDLSCGEYTWTGNGCTYYKVWSDQGEEIEGYDYRFPFVDIWSFTQQEENVVFNHGIVFKQKEFYPFKKVVFEEVEFSIPFDAVRCLDRQYETWKSVIHVYPYSHRREKACFYPMMMPIKVTSNGRLIAEDGK